MKLTVLTLFPELIDVVINSSITGRARSAGLFDLSLIQIRDYAVNSYGKVDDYCYGGGTGMLMMAEPIYKAWQAACPQCIEDTKTGNAADKTRTIYLSPRGTLFTQDKARSLAADYSHLIFLCGHYEGVDQRVIDTVVDEELSIGDYVLTGGELAACVVIDAILRLIPGVLPDEAAYTRESHMDGLLEYPQYTRPAEWFDQKVPDVLLSGHQANIEAWQTAQSAIETMLRRPDLLANKPLDEEQWHQLIKIWLEGLAPPDFV
ncbi:MAG: tRNA (guanosine(37)-N1)-methyltransferase TrmD [Bacillota bacterium]|nr:tRNA (guanosine(37)-N1)-methyltransferase TrmD [Bacillota bacterium]